MTLTIDEAMTSMNINFDTCLLLYTPFYVLTREIGGRVKRNPRSSGRGSGV